MAPFRVAGGLSQSSENSGIFFQGDSQSHNLINSRLSSSFGKSANCNFENLGPVAGDLNHTGLNSVDNSVPSVGASSMVTDANSAFSGGGGPHLQRSTSVNNEPYLRYPGSPLSFTSNNISVSGSSVIDGPGPRPTGMNQGAHHHDPNPNPQQAIQSQHQFPQVSQTGQLPISMGSRIPNSFVQDPANLSQLQKKPRLDIKQEDILQQQVLHQLLQRQDSMNMQSNNPQLQAILQQRLRQQQMLQVMSPIQRIQLQQQQQQIQMRQVQQQMGATKNPYETGGVCARRLMQYLYHQRQRPQENSFAYWRKFVAEYYAPRAKKRWCLSQYDNVGHHALGVFPQAAMDAWQCDICGIKSGRGFEATYEVLPRLNEIKFGSGVIDELLFVDLPRERRFVNGIMMLEYGKAVQESVYEQLRVVREGQLRIVFSQDLKILSWDFCARCHEELLPRRLVAPQVSQLLQVAQKCQSTLADCGSEGLSSQDLQTSNNMVVTASRQLAKNLESQSLNDLGFPKRYIRCLQISEVVNSMKDLMDYCRDNKVGPIDGLKTYPRSSESKLQIQRMHEIEQLASIRQPRIMTNNPIAIRQPGIIANNPLAIQQTGIMKNNPNIGNNPNILTNRGNSSLTNYPYIMTRQNSMNSSSSEPSFHNNNPNQTPSFSFQGPLSSVHQNFQLGQTGQQRTLNGPNVNPNAAVGGLGYGPNTTPGTPSGSSNVVGGNVGPALSKNNSCKGDSNSDSSQVGGDGVSNGGFNQKTAELPPNLHLMDEIPDLPHEFTDNGFFGSDFDENTGYGWKG